MVKKKEIPNTDGDYTFDEDVLVVLGIDDKNGWVNYKVANSGNKKLQDLKMGIEQFKLMCNIKGEIKWGKVKKR